MRSALLDGTTLSNPIPTPPGFPDARQRGHLAELAAVTETLRRLSRLGATFVAHGLSHRAHVLLQISTMSEEEERAYLAGVSDLLAEFDVEDAA